MLLTKPVHPVQPVGATCISCYGDTEQYHTVHGEEEDCVGGELAIRVC